MFDAYQRTLTEVEELNMIPVMNLFIVLIPFLLSAAAFYQVAVIPTSTPQQVVQPSSDEDPAAVMVNLVIRADGGLTLSVSGGGDADEDGLRALGAELPAKAGEADLAGLQAALAALKARYPASETAFILPEDSVGVQMLVEIIDAVRERTTQAGAVDNLFPVAVLAQLATPPPAEPVPDVDLGLLPEAPPGDEDGREPPADAPDAPDREGP